MSAPHLARRALRALRLSLFASALACFFSSGCATRPISCSNGVVDGVETAADCGGGVCPSCALGLTCLRDADCQSGACVRGHCRAPSTCTNGVRDVGETGVDCGGVCAPCGEGVPCSVDADCVGGACQGGRCGVASCFDQRRDGHETDRDCGGPDCDPCDPGATCLLATDCASQSCVSGHCYTGCSDGKRDDEETDIDCGGGTCGQCAEGRACLADRDCLSTVCLGGRCQSMSMLCPPGYRLDAVAGCICDLSRCGECCNVSEGNVCGLAGNADGNNCGAQGQVCFRCDLTQAQGCQHGHAGDYCATRCDAAACGGCCSMPFTRIPSYCLHGDDDFACGKAGSMCQSCPVGSHCSQGRCVVATPDGGM